MQFSEITAVVQGPIFKETANVLGSIRRALPGAAIVLSTWNGQDVSGLDYDQLVCSEDPGSIRNNVNVNRQIVSTLAGLQKVSTQYTLKIRTDTFLESSDFLSYFSKFPKRSQNFRVFEERILIASKFTILHNSKIDSFWSKLFYSSAYTSLFSTLPFSMIQNRNLRLFHPSDWIHFGRTSDLLFLWDIPLEDPCASEAFEKDYGYQYEIEQYIWVSCLRKKYDVAYRHRFDFTLENEEKSTESVVNNFVCLDTDLWRFRNVKYAEPQWKSWGASTYYFTFYKWQRLYQQLCDVSYIPSWTPLRIKSLGYLPYRFFVGLARIILRR